MGRDVSIDAARRRTHSRESSSEARELLQNTRVHLQCAVAPTAPLTLHGRMI